MPSCFQHAYTGTLTHACEPTAQVAVRFKNPAMVQALVEMQGIDLDYQDAQGNTAVHRAAEMNRCDMLQALLNAGAKSDVKNLMRHSPLMVAAKSGYYDPIPILIKHGADLYSKDKNNKMALQLVPMLSRVLKYKLECMMGWSLLEVRVRACGHACSRAWLLSYVCDKTRESTCMHKHSSKTGS